ncbi:hypothetical protein WDZ92_09320 [Nostoc sp. NIES-2111]
MLVAFDWRVRRILYLEAWTRPSQVDAGFAGVIFSLLGILCVAVAFTGSERRMLWGGGLTE